MKLKRISVLRVYNFLSVGFLRRRNGNIVFLLFVCVCAFFCVSCLLRVRETFAHSDDHHNQNKILSGNSN